MEDVVAILCDEVRELNRLGCTYVQLDAPHDSLLVDPGWRAFYESRGWPAERWLSYGVALDNQVIDAGRPATFGFHLCRGNQHSRWLVAGGYEPVARQVLAGVHADRLLLEYDDERSGGFQPLALVPDDKLVVLGLVTTKTPGLESGEELERRLRAAAALVGMERLALGTQCGFATSVGGNAISVDDERSRLARCSRSWLASSSSTLRWVLAALAMAWSVHSQAAWAISSRTASSRPSRSPCARWCAQNSCAPMRNARSSSSTGTPTLARFSPTRPASSRSAALAERCSWKAVSDSRTIVSTPGRSASGARLA